MQFKNETAERAILSIIIDVPYYRDDIFQQIKDKDLFVSDYGKRVFSVCKELYTDNKDIDLVTVMSFVNDAEMDKYLEFLTIEARSSANYTLYIRDLERQWKMRELSGIAEELVKIENTINIDDAVKKFDEDYSNFTLKNIQKEETAAEIIAGLRVLAASDTPEQGHDWGLPTLTQKTRGMLPGKTYIIGGLKKCGKTKFAIYTMHSLLKAGINTLFISMELQGADAMRWLVERESGAYFFDTFSRQKTMTALDSMEKMPFFIDSRSALSLQEIKQKIIYETRKHKIQVVFIDYLQKMSFDDAGGRALAIQKAASGIADMARDLKISIIVLSQLGNVAESAPFPTVAHLKESGGIGEAADCILLLNNLDRITNNITDSKFNLIDITIAQQRGGQSGVLIPCEVDLACNVFAEISKEKREEIVKSIKTKNKLIMPDNRNEWYK